MRFAGWYFVCTLAAACAQEAVSGFELRATATTEAAYSRELTAWPRDGAPVIAGFRSIFYPTWKLSKHWTISGAVEVHSRPYSYSEFGTQGYGVKADILQAHLSYSRFWNNRSLVVRVGQLSSAFGSFLLRYDDNDNPLIGMPLSYGYYYQPVTIYGLAGAQVDATAGKLDVRAQFVNSSPANRRSIFDRDQYGNWAGGAGYTIRQGLRVGVSAYRGPYLDRHYEYYNPGEARPRDLPATAYGLDVQWGRGPWTVYGEYQRFQMTYHAIPTYKESVAYVEARRVLHPRWYVATRAGYSHDYDTTREYETIVGFRPNRRQLLKIGYDIRQSPDTPGTLGNHLAVQLVTVFRPISIARD
ncbi:MAG: hypothetical protein ACR2NN_18230 [Bryobacteraceae bacterium]